MPFDLASTNFAAITNGAPGATNSLEFITRMDRYRVINTLKANSYDIRLLFRWPLLPNGAGNSWQTFRLFTAGSITNEPSGGPLYFVATLPLRPGAVRTKATSVIDHPPSALLREAKGSARSSSAFSLIEVIVAVTLMIVIILGLMAMFDQTQRAFRLGMNQTDVLESGRLATEMLVREMEQTTPAYQPYGTATNFFVQTVTNTLQSLAGNAAQRKNVMDDVFFLTRENQTWTGIGYFVRTNSASNPVLPGGCRPCRLPLPL